VPPDPVYVGAVRSFAGAVARQVGLDEELIDDLRLAVSEACTEFMEPGSTSRVEVSLFAEPGRLSVEVRSEGTEVGRRREVGGPGSLGIDRDEVIRALFPDVQITGSDQAWVVSFSATSRQSDLA